METVSPVLGPFEPVLRPQFFRTIAMMTFVLKKPCQQLRESRTNSSALSSPEAISRACCCIAPSRRSFPQCYLHGFVSVQHPASLPPSEALPKLFPRFRVRPAFCLAPSQQSSPQAISTVSCPSRMLHRSLPAKLSQAISTVSCPSSMLYRSPPAKLSPS